MNDKEIFKIKEWLDGQHRYKLLDCDEMDIPKLKGARLHVWMACFIHSDDDQSWLSNETLMYHTGLSKHTVIRARRWLVQNGWLSPTGQVAAMKYKNPSRGSYDVKVYSVDTPNARIASPDSGSAVSGSAENAPKVCGCGSGCIGDCGCTVTGVSPLTDKDENQEPKPTPVFRSSASATPKKTRMAQDGTPWPDDFNEWTNVDRTFWLEQHKLLVQGVKASVPVEDDDEFPLLDEPSAQRMEFVGSADPTPNPATPSHKFKCPACDYSHKYDSSVAEHMEKEHPELGQQSFKITCPKDGCRWHKWWNKVQNDKADMDAQLLEHLEEQHNPNSPRYDPYGKCECGFWGRLSGHDCKKKDKEEVIPQDSVA